MELAVDTSVLKKEHTFTFYKGEGSSATQFEKVLVHQTHSGETMK